MDQFFDISSRWQVAICRQCRHAVWPRDIGGHLKDRDHRLPAKEALRIKREVQATSVIQDPAEFEPIQYLEEPIPELKVYHDAWTCTVEPTCHFTALAQGTLKNHCAKQHPGSRRRSQYRRQGHYDPWVRVTCQQMFPSSRGSNCYRVGSVALRVDDGPPIDAVAEARRQVREAQEELVQRTLRDIEDR